MEVLDNLFNFIYTVMVWIFYPSLESPVFPVLMVFMIMVIVFGMFKYIGLVKKIPK